MSASDKMLLAGLAAAAMLAIWIVNRGSANAGASIGGAAVDMANGVITGAVVGAGQVVGIPSTSKTQCQQDIADGKTWDASFSCPAGTFIKYAIFG